MVAWQAVTVVVPVLQDSAVVQAWQGAKLGAVLEAVLQAWVVVEAVQQEVRCEGAALEAAVVVPSARRVRLSRQRWSSAASRM